MNNIFEKLKKSEDSEDLLENNEQSKLAREWWILGHSVKCLHEAGQIKPMYATHQNPPAPDFMLFDQRKEELCEIEIAEVLKPGRKRGAESRTEKMIEIKDSAVLDDPWASFRDVLTKKTSKNYPRGTWLLLYHNMWSFDFKPWPEWPEHLFKQIMSDRSLTQRPQYLEGLENQMFGQVLVLSSMGNSLVRIFPHNEIIHLAGKR